MYNEIFVRSALAEMARWNANETCRATTPTTPTASTSTRRTDLEPVATRRRTSGAFPRRSGAPR
jgi:hypothetical protein